ncbi:hypothetical protein BDV97DRAFT_366548 [Delphinella strobiligena]|nr:hypothetical protein BDV97DRAFT_366548 [Delphinella strobiligena]
MTSFDRDVAKLRGTQNFKAWKTHAMAVLIVEGCYDLVDGTFPKPIPSANSSRVFSPKRLDELSRIEEDWLRKNNAATGIITRLCVPAIAAEITEYDSAKLAWEYLCNTYEEPLFTRVCSIWQDFVTFRFRVHLSSGDPVLGGYTRLSGRTIDSELSLQCLDYKRILEELNEIGQTVSNDVAVANFVHVVRASEFPIDVHEQDVCLIPDLDMVMRRWVAETTASALMNAEMA